jgi:hypothetical protein
MNPPIRKLGDPIPPRLVLGPQGVLSMADDSDPRDYLQKVRSKWIKQGLMAEGEPIAISICDVASMERLEKDAWLARNQGV